METTNQENNQEPKTKNQKPPTLVGMVKNAVTPAAIIALIKKRPLVGVAAVLVSILVVLVVFVGFQRRNIQYFNLATPPTPSPVLATPPPILSEVGKSEQFQTLEASFSAIMQIVKTVDLSESQLSMPILETKLTFDE